jgi:hypothetical protein
MTTARRQHRLKGNRGTEGPSNFLFFDTETMPYVSDRMPNKLRHRLRLGVAIAVRIEGGEPTRRQVLYFRDPSCFWAFLISRLRKREPLWVYAHNLAFDFRLVGGYEVITRNNSERWQVILADPPTIIKGQINGSKLVFVDSLNYCRTSLAAIGDGVGLPKVSMPSFTASERDWFRYCERDTEILERYMLGLRSYLQENDCGTWGKTGSQCAMNLYRHRHMPTPIVLHATDEATELERKAYYGGQLECFWIGHVSGPIYQFDVNSLYPYIMREYRFPCRLIGLFSNVNLRWLKCRLNTYGAVAECLCVSNDRTLPKRFNGKTHYVKGVYRTYLCGEELRNAVDAGNVVQVFHVALYELANLFESYVDELWAERREAILCGNKAKESTVKTLLNGLSGKWAQRSPRYHPLAGQSTPILWGPYYRKDILEERVIEMRAIAGVAQELVRHDENWQSFPAISAFITSAGREHMRTLRECAGRESIYYQDNDSLMVDEYGADKLLLAGHYGKAELGKLKLVRRAESALIRGPKDYELDGVRVCGAKQIHARQVGPDTWEQWDFVNAEGMLRFNELPEAMQMREVRNLQPTYKKGRVMPSGLTLPFEVYAF